MAELIVALDMDSVDEVERLLDHLPAVRWAKVGSTLFTRAGPDIVRRLQRRGIWVFLDLKWHDIPHQVVGAVQAAADLGVDLATVHALGGPLMMAAAQEAAGPMRLVAVTVLTSHTGGELATVLGGTDTDPATEGERLARLAVEAGLAGVVTSPLEAARLRRALGAAAWLVVPGIRPGGSAADDPARTASVRDAVRAGATHLVVGRPITRAADPALVYQAMCEEAAS